MLVGWIARVDIRVRSFHHQRLGVVSPQFMNYLTIVVLYLNIE